MAWEAKDWFTALGSGLGTIAFFSSLFKPVAEANVKKWEKIEETFCGPHTIDKIHREFNKTHSLSRIEMKGLYQLWEAIENMDDAVEFKTLGRKKIHTLLQVFRLRMKELDQELKSPNFEFDTDHLGTPRHVLSTIRFPRSPNGEIIDTIDYSNYRLLIGVLLSSLRASLRNVQRLANRTEVEYLLPTKLWRFPTS